MCRERKKVIKNRKWTIFVLVNLISEYIFKQHAVYLYPHQWSKLENLNIILSIVRSIELQLLKEPYSERVWCACVSYFKTFVHFSQSVLDHFHWCKQESYGFGTLFSIYILSVYWCFNSNLEREKSSSYF